VARRPAVEAGETAARAPPEAGGGRCPVGLLIRHEPIVLFSHRKPNQPPAAGVSVTKGFVRIFLSNISLLLKSMKWRQKLVPTFSGLT
jgi:hypothetical protein